MNKGAEYFDHLPYEKIEALRSLIGGGELDWKQMFPKLPLEKKLEVGKVVFGRSCSKVTMVFERNWANGFDIPVILAEYE